MNDFDTFISEGIVGFYRSFEVTQLFLTRKSDKTRLNLLVLAVAEEKEFAGHDLDFLLPKPYALNKEYSLGVMRYWMSLDEARERHQILDATGCWDYFGDASLLAGPFKPLLHQYVPSGASLSKVLKNNFYGGSHVLEFFDEEKRELGFLLDPRSSQLLESLTQKIQEIAPIDLYVLRERLGNVFFQFPINLLEVNSRTDDSWENFHFQFT